LQYRTLSSFVPSLKVLPFLPPSSVLFPPLSSYLHSFLQYSSILPCPPSLSILPYSHPVGANLLQERREGPYLSRSGASNSGQQAAQRRRS
jgi:hypothetical protein